MIHDPLDVALFTAAVLPVAGLVVVGVRKYVREVARLLAVLDQPDTPDPDDDGPSPTSLQGRADALHAMGEDADAIVLDFRPVRASGWRNEPR